MVAGYTLGHNTNIALVRLLPNGTFDPDFGGGDGRVVTDLGGTDYGFDVAIHPDGGIVVAGERVSGSGSRVAVLRYGPKGRLDKDFGGGDGVVLTSFGKKTQGASAVVVGASGNITIGGYTSNGTHEPLRPGPVRTERRARQGLRPQGARHHRPHPRRRRHQGHGDGGRRQDRGGRVRRGGADPAVRGGALPGSRRPGPDLRYEEGLQHHRPVEGTRHRLRDHGRSRRPAADVRAGRQPPAQRLGPGALRREGTTRSARSRATARRS